MKKTEKNFLRFCEERKDLKAEITLSEDRSEQRLPARQATPVKGAPYPQKGFALSLAGD